MTDAERIIELEQEVARLKDETATFDSEHPLERQARLIRSRSMLKKMIDEACEGDSLLVLRWCRPEMFYASTNKEGAMSKADTAMMCAILQNELVDAYQDTARVRLVPEEDGSGPDGLTVE